MPVASRSKFRFFYEVVRSGISRLNHWSAHCYKVCCQYFANQLYKAFVTRRTRRGQSFVIGDVNNYRSTKRHRRAAGLQYKSPARFEVPLHKMVKPVKSVFLLTPSLLNKTSLGNKSECSHNLIGLKSKLSEASSNRESSGLEIYDC